MKKVKRIQAQRKMQQERKRYEAMTEVPLYWLLKPPTDRDGGWTKDSELDVPLPRSRNIAESDDSVQVELELDYPITADVPVELRKAVFSASSVREVCLKIRDMYTQLYEEDDRLGGPKNQSQSEPVRGQQEFNLIHSYKASGARIKNRGFGAYIWGHDMEDLAVEGLLFEWKSPQSVIAHVLMGS